MPPSISYAQYQEDVLLKRLFPEDHKGFYIDAGAADPMFLSVTKLFYDRGWRGVNVEPQGHFYEALCRERPRDVNLRVGLSNREGKMTLYRPTMGELGTVSPEAAENARRLGFEVTEEEVAVTTLAKVCAEHQVNEIDFLKVDVEGYERAVLEGADWGRWRPRAIVIEATLPTTAIRCEHLWEDILIGAGYHLAFFDGTNNYYLREEDRHLDPVLGAPPSAGDEYVLPGYQRYIRDLESQVAHIGADLGQCRTALQQLWGSPLLGRLLRLYRRVGRIEGPPAAQSK